MEELLPRRFSVVPEGVANSVDKSADNLQREDAAFKVNEEKEHTVSPLVVSLVVLSVFGPLEADLSNTVHVDLGRNCCNLPRLVPARWRFRGKKICSTQSGLTIEQKWWKSCLR